MLPVLLIVLPQAATLVTLACRTRAALRSVTTASNLALLGLSLVTAHQVAAGAAPESWWPILTVDPLGALIAVVISAVATASSIRSDEILAHELREERGSEVYIRLRLRRYTWFFNLFVSSMMFVSFSSNLGLMWVGIEATTLASVFLVGFIQSKPALEAAWKYLILCSVGIAFALIGTIVIYYADTIAVGKDAASLDWTEILKHPKLNPFLVRLAFVFALLGYGTKAGLAPLHSWLPDAHSEAPAPISALLSGVLLKCALLGILRFHMISIRAQGYEFSGNLILILGVLSVALAGVFVLVQGNLKRLLAYSSLEHVGIVAIGVGVGGPIGLLGAMLHLFNHAMTKAFMFLVAGTVAMHYETREIGRIRGVVRAMPFTGVYLCIGSLALVGAPPFGIFASKFRVLWAGFQTGHWAASIALLAALAGVFAGVMGALGRMVSGTPEVPRARESWSAILVPAALLVAAAAFGVALPEPVEHFFELIVDEIRG